MAEYTTIPEVDSTVNPVWGCNGCELWVRKTNTRLCYAGRFTTTRGRKLRGGGSYMDFDYPRLFPGQVQHAARWRDLKGVPRDSRPNSGVFAKPWLDTLPRLIFISDMGDALSQVRAIDEHGQPIGAVPFAFLKEEVVDVVTTEQGRRHRWLWMTRRPNTMLKFAEWLSTEHCLSWPDNLWVATSVTCPANFPRIRSLAQVGNEKIVRMISVEPLREELSLAEYLSMKNMNWWVMVGGETRQQRGELPHECKSIWVLKLRDECRAHGVPFFMDRPGDNFTLDDGQLAAGSADWDSWPATLDHLGLKVREAPRLIV